MATFDTDQEVNMRQARYVVRKADGVGGNPIPEDEPCIVIRGQDVLALDAIDFYLREYQGLQQPSPEVVAELRSHRQAIVDWQQAHPPKVADR